MNGLGGFQILILDLEARGQHAIDGGMRCDLVFDRQGIVVLIAQESIVLEQLLEVAFRDHQAVRHGSVFLLERYFHLANDERNIGRIFQAQVHHGDAVVLAQGCRPDFEDLSVEHQVRAFGGRKDEKDRNRDHHDTDAEKYCELFAHLECGALIAQQFTESLQADDIIADGFNRSGDRYGDQQTNCAPQSAPEHERDGHHEGV
jgi:hypothetical protein